jgi:hypothetical protein
MNDIEAACHELSTKYRLLKSVERRDVSVQAASDGSAEPQSNDQSSIGKLDETIRLNAVNDLLSAKRVVESVATTERQRICFRIVSHGKVINEYVKEQTQEEATREAFKYIMKDHFLFDTDGQGLTPDHVFDVVKIGSNTIFVLPQKETFELGNKKLSFESWEEDKLSRILRSKDRQRLTPNNSKREGTIFPNVRDPAAPIKSRMPDQQHAAVKRKKVLESIQEASDA